jgi:hypothetical protein
VQRYNGYLSADINGGPAPGVSSGQAQAIMERLAAQTLPIGIAYEWTELTYQQILAGNTTLYVFPLCVLLVFLVLAAQYESWTLPLAVILIVPMGVLSAMFGVWVFGYFGKGGDNNIFTQIGLFVLVGLACKNAILIVEFARELELQGRTCVEAAIEASRLRLRPILMTSFAFIMGVVPLVVSFGPGAEMRQAMGVAVFSGMIGVTLGVAEAVWLADEPGARLDVGDAVAEAVLDGLDVSVALDDPDAKFEFMVPRRAPLRFETIPADVCAGQNNEWRVTGFFWDLLDLHADAESVEAGFAKLWKALEGTRAGSSLDAARKLKSSSAVDEASLRAVWKQNFLTQDF